MSRLSFIIFPEFKDQISAEKVKNSLDLVESIIAYSKGNRLNSDEINRICKKLGSRITGSRLYSGGSSVLFGWSFQLGKVGSIIIKPYYNRQLTQLILHYLTAEDCIQNLDKLKFEYNKKHYQIQIPRVIGLAKIVSISRIFPTLLAEEVVGESIQGQALLIKKISFLVRDLALQGFICDPYASNWKTSMIKNQKIIHYIDLLSSNRIPNAKKRIADLLQNFE
ncbi:MAG: hypothetical protein ACFE8U_08630 [Candidatus Hermodarchaeota archaeon]